MKIKRYSTRFMYLYNWQFGDSLPWQQVRISRSCPVTIQLLFHDLERKSLRRGLWVSNRPFCIYYRIHDIISRIFQIESTNLFTNISQLKKKTISRSAHQIPILRIPNICLFTFWAFFPDKHLKLVWKYNQNCQCNSWY